ncbi:MAG: orotidine-5'-phosphate decarboxylase [Bdellovibrionales bacterium]
MSSTKDQVAAKLGSRYLKNPIIAALDVDDAGRALALADELGEIVGGLKVGPRLVMREGASLIQKLAARGRVFVDMKHFDIPSTMTSAIQASFDAGATLVTVHALSGLEALRQCAELEQKLNQIRPFKVLAVTILTSWNQNSVPGNFQSQPIATHVRTLAELAHSAGLSGLVCSGHELELVQDLNLFKVVPGIRVDLENHQDQKRVMDPKTALKKGAQALVVGRPILEARSPRETALDYVLTSIE